MSAMLTADWFLLGRDLYFRKFEIYSMEWHNEVCMDAAVASCAPYGGPIAITRDRSKVVKIHGSGQTIIGVYSGSGKLMKTINWEGGPIIKMGWTNDETFICVQDNGIVSLYNLHDEFVRHVKVCDDVKVTKVRSAVIFTNPQNLTGIAVLTTTSKIHYVNSILKPVTRTLKLHQFAIQPTSWVVISKDSNTEVLLAKEKELYRLKHGDENPTMLEADLSHQYTSILIMAVSLSMQHIALFTDAGYLWLGSSDFRRKYCEVDTEKIVEPKQLVWCGNEAVVAFWEKTSTLLIVGKHGKKIIFSYDGSVHLMPEIDGIRVLSAGQHEIVQKVPDVVQKIFRLNSTEPGSFLLEASKQFQKRSHRADEYICLVKDDLKKAVEQCLEASGYEFDTDVQKMLIRASQFGKCFIADIDSDEYVRMCRVLRVLNAVRNRKIGIPITYTQLRYQGHHKLLDRLVARHHYYLAIEIAKYLKMQDKDGSSRILVHWAKYKVSQLKGNDETLSKQISDKLGYIPGISYSEIAKTAEASGHKQLAIKLLQYETKASKQVDLLLILNERRQALVKAIESGDSDLVYEVIFKSSSNMDLGEYKKMIADYPVALALYLKHYRDYPEQRREMLRQIDDHNSQAQLSVAESLKSSLDNHTQKSSLWSAVESYKKGMNDLYRSVCEENIKLLERQAAYESKLNAKGEFVGKSVHDTCELLLKMNELKLAEKFKSEFKIPDRRYWWLKLNSLAENWTELENFSKIKKSPIGYAPFVDICLQHDKLNEAKKYLPRVSEELKIKYYVKANLLEDATKIAFEQRDIQGLLHVQSKYPPQSASSEKINALITQLAAKKGPQSALPLFS